MTRLRTVLSWALAVFMVAGLVPSPAVARTFNAGIPIAIPDTRSSGTTVTAGPKGIAIADLNADGFPDVAVANFRQSTVSIFKGSAAGLPAVPTKTLPLPATGSPASVMAADVTFDGNPELFVGDTWRQCVYQFASSSVGTLPTTLTDTIRSYVETQGPAWPGPVSNPFDFDIAPRTSALDPAQTMMILIPRYYTKYPTGPDPENASDPGGYARYDFTPSGVATSPVFKDFGSAMNPYAALVGRLDADPWPDMGFVGYKSGLFLPFYQSVLGNFGSPGATNVQTGGNMFDAERGDFNHDGRDDLATLSYNTQNGVGAVTITLQNSISWLADGNPTQVLDTGGAPTNLAVGDVNGDGLDDAVVVNSYNSGLGTNRRGTVGIFLQDKDGLLGPMREIEVGRQPYASAIGDINKDGRNEIVVTNEVDNTIQVLSIGDPAKPGVTADPWPHPAQWVNQTRGSFDVTAPADFDGIGGFYYAVDRSPIATPTAASTWAVLPTGQTGVTIPYDFRSNALAVFDVDGDWYFHVRARDVLSNLGATTDYHVKIDTHAPTAPALTGMPSGWIPRTWQTVSWLPSIDMVSGVANYVITQDGSTVATLSASAREYTVSGLADGSNVVGVAAVDAAGNISQYSEATIKVDSAAPYVRINAPMKNQTVGLSTTFSAVASDAAGVTKVVFAIDGKTMVTDTKAPYDAGVTLKGFHSGKHTLTVTAYDQLGAVDPTHRTTVSVPFNLDRTPPNLSNVTAGPNPFFPRLQDGYRDTSLVKFKMYEDGKSLLTVQTRKGKVIQSLEYSMAAGKRSISWNGQTSKHKVAAEGTYYYRLTVFDQYGNSTSTGLFPVTVRYYILVRISASSVQLVEH